MDYLYFDLECADGTHICSFGYVIADENFNVKEKRDILINPCCEFKLGKYRKTPYIELAYPEKEFYKSPKFSDCYEEIKGLLYGKDTVLLGHAVASDLEFLDIACDKINRKRYRLNVYDTQKIYARYSEAKELRALEKIMEELEINTEHLCAHKSCDDAEMSMLTLKQVCKNNNIGVAEFLKTVNDCTVNRLAMDLAYKKREVRKLIGGAKGKHPESKDWDKIFVSDVLDGFSAHISHELIKVIYNAGYAVTLDADKCDIYVTGKNNIEINKIKGKEKIKIINYAELSEMIGVIINEKGEIKYSENNNAVNSLRLFFEKAKTNNSNKRKNKSNKK